MQRRGKGLWTHRGQTLTATSLWTTDVTQQLVVLQRTLEDAVTQVSRMQTDGRVTTAVEAWTRVAVTLRLVLPARAVIDPVTHNVHRQTVGVRTQEVGVWTFFCTCHTSLAVAAVSIKIHNCRRRQEFDSGFCDTAIKLVGTISAVLSIVAPSVYGHALTIAAAFQSAALLVNTEILITAIRAVRLEVTH